MRWFFLDGITATASVAILENYFSLFILALGGSLAQIGLMNSLSNLSAALMLLPGAVLAERVKSRKKLILISAGGITRFAFLLIALFPFAYEGTALVFIIVGLKIISDAFNNLAIPAWMAMVPDIIPLHTRGKYFGARNAVTGLVGMAATFIAGHIITAIDSPVGYQVGVGMAFLIGVIATFSYAQIVEVRGEDAPPPDLGSYHPRSLFKTFKSDTAFSVFCISQMVWNFSISLAGPFFITYLVEEAGGTAAAIGSLTIISAITGMIGQRYFGSLTDKIGSRKIIILVGLIIPILPFIWFFIHTPWQAAPLYFFSGFLWAGFGLATFNYILEISPAQERSRYSALYQITLTISAAIGAALGGILAQNLGYKFLFGLSGIGRLLSTLIFIYLAQKIHYKVTDHSARK